MSDLVFLGRASPVGLAALFELAAGADPEAGAAYFPSGLDGSRHFRAVAALDRAGPDDVTVFLDGADPDELAATRAGACFVAPEHAGMVPPETIALPAKRPGQALRRAAVLIYGANVSAAGPVFERQGIDPTAVVHRDARLEQEVTVEPGAVVGQRAEIGRGTRIGVNVVTGPGVRIGRDCVVDAQASICAALVGDRVCIHAGARIGIGSERDPRLGRVIVQDDVEVGANAVIERGHIGDTMIGERATIGTLVVIGADQVVDRLDTRG